MRNARVPRVRDSFAATAQNLRASEECFQHEAPWKLAAGLAKGV